MLDNSTTINGTMDSLACTAGSLRGPIMLPYSFTLTTIVRSLQTFLYILTFVFGIILNSLVIILVAKYKKLHVRTFAVALQVVVLNLIVSSTVLMLRPVTSIANQWLFGEAMCVFTGYIYLTFLLLRALLMLVFVIDRFLSVFFLFSYPRHSSIIMLVTSVATWMFAVGARTIGFPGVLDCYSFISTSFLCVHSSRCSTECARTANVNLGIVFGPATIVPIILYALLYWRAKKLKKNHFLLAPSSSPSNGSVVTKKSEIREWKANITFFLLFISVFALTTPVVALNLIFAAIRRMNGPSPVLYVLSSILSSMSALIVIADPIVIMRHRDVHDILSKVKGNLIRSLRCSKFN